MIDEQSEPRSEPDGADQPDTNSGVSPSEEKEILNALTEDELDDDDEPFDDDEFGVV